MDRNGPSRRRVCGVLFVLAIGTAPLAAQDAPPALDALLAQLGRTTPAAWEARTAAVRAAAGAARDAAKALREEGAAKCAAAEKEEQAAAGLDAENAQLAKVRELIASLTFRDPAAQGEGSKTEPGQLDALIAQLTGLPVTAWDARAHAITAAAAKARGAAKELREQAQQRDAEAAAKDAAGKALEAEAEKLGRLRELIATLKPETLARVAAPAEASAKPADAAAKAPELPAKSEAPAKEPAAPPKPAAAAPAAPPMPTPAAKGAPADERLVTYDDHVFPIVDENCMTCHDRTDAKGGLDLSTHATALSGGGSGRTIRPGDPDASRLYLLVSHKEKPTMPPDEPRIAAELIETIRLWIAQGAPKDLAQARKLAGERAAARAAAEAEAAAKAGANAAVAVVMPTDLPPVAKVWPARPGALRAIALSPHAPLLAVPGQGQVLLLHAGDLRELGVLDFPYGTVEALAFSADGARLLAAGGRPGRQGGAALFDVRTGAVLGRFGEQKDAVLAADLSPDGARVAVGGTRRRVEVFAVDGGARLWEGAHDEWVTAVAFSPDGALCASADRAGNVLVREAANGREVHALGGHEGIVAALAFSPDAALLATAGADRTVRAFRMKDGAQAWSQGAHGDGVLGLAWRSATRLLSGGADGRVVHWRSDGNREPDPPPVGEWIYGVACRDDRAFAADWAGRVTVLDLGKRAVVAQVAPLAIAQ